MKKPVKVVIHPRLGGEPVEDIDLAAAMIIAGWSDDPGTGQAVFTDDGREVLNPVPMAPPVGYKAELSMMQIMENMVKKHLAGLDDEEEVDSLEDSVDFDVQEEYDPQSPYEIELMEEFPGMPEAEPKEEEPDVEKPPPKEEAAVVVDSKEKGA